MSIYSDYKPFRNYLRQFGLLDSLIDLWRYTVHITDGVPLPNGYPNGHIPLYHGSLDKQLYAWDMPVLVRETILNAGTRAASKSLGNWEQLATAINYIRQLDDDSYAHGSADPPDVMFELHRIAHRQFPWQANLSASAFIRAFRVYGGADIDRVVQRELGMNTKQCLRLGAAVTGHFRSKWGLSTNQNYNAIDVPTDASKRFFERLTIPLDTLRKETAKFQRYDRDWLYTWNPLEAKPLISVDADHPDRVVCPIPTYLLRRASAGLFYDLINTSEFDNLFGHSFQSYIGQCAVDACKPPRFRVISPAPYYVGVNKKHGADWMLSDNTGHLFLECKTKRLTLNARTQSDPAALESDLSTLAAAVAQNYKNIQDAIAGKTEWTFDELPIYPFVITLEEWFLLSPRVREMLDERVAILLGEHAIPNTVLQTMPYSIASSNEFEIAIHIVARFGIAHLMSQKTSPEHRWWSLFPFLTTQFRQEVGSVRRTAMTRDLNRLMDGIVPT